jgi:methionyl aminopeptidase
VSRIDIMSSRDLDRMRAACQLAADTLVMVGDELRAGMTTDDINTIVHEYTLAHGARPSPLGYHGFPKSVCTSVNEVVCHGIPGGRVLKNGDIINVDVTSYLPAKDGFHGDTSATFYVGEPSPEAQKVVEVSRHCLELGIAQVKDNARLGDIGAAIQEYAESQGCSVVRDYVGHGIGRQFHTAPQVPHYGTRGAGKRIKAGMVFTIEPMINLGEYGCEVLADGWTVLTRDRSLSAQFEHTILVTQSGCEVLTSRKRPLRHSEDKPWAKLGQLSTRAAFEARRADSATAAHG